MRVSFAFQPEGTLDPFSTASGAFERRNNEALRPAAIVG